MSQDLKPENVLLSKDGIKIADMGMARRVGSNQFVKPGQERKTALCPEARSLRGAFGTTMCT